MSSYPVGCGYQRMSYCWRDAKVVNMRGRYRRFGHQRSSSPLSAKLTAHSELAGDAALVIEAHSIGTKFRARPRCVSAGASASLSRVHGQVGGPVRSVGRAGRTSLYADLTMGVIQPEDRKTAK